MFDKDELDNFKRNYDAYTASRPMQTQQPKKPGGIRGLLLNALPIVGGAAGAALGTVAAPVAGTAVGGSIGSGLGEVLRQKLMGEDINIGSVGREAAFGAVPGVGRIVKAARGVKAAEQTTEAAMQARKGIVQKARDTASQTSQEGFGLTVGQSQGRGKTLTPDKADELQDFITNRSQQYGGIRAGKPIEQARDAQKVYNNVTRSLDDTLAKIDRPIQLQEPAAILAGAAAKVADNPAITGTTKTLEKFKAKIEKAKNLKELEAIRREADDLAFTSTGAGKTSAAAQSHAVRDAIDEFITPLSDDYKAVKGDYTLARDALEATSKANKSAKGFKIPFVDAEVGKQAISGIRNKAASVVGSTNASPQSTGFRPFMSTAKATLPQAGVRAAGSVLFGTPFVGTGKEEATAQPTAATPDAGAMPQPDQQLQQSPQSTSIFSDPSKVEEAYAKALMAGDTKTASAIIAGYELFGKTKQEKPMSAETSKVVANANSGLDSLSQIRGILEQDPSVRTKTLVPGRGLFGGAGAAALGTSSYDTAARNIADVITRLRTGAALTESEERFYKSQLPQGFDPPETVEQKLRMFEDLFQSVSNRSGTAGTDLQAGLEA